MDESFKRNSNQRDENLGKSIRAAERSGNSVVAEFAGNIPQLGLGKSPVRIVKCSCFILINVDDGQEYSRTYQSPEHTSERDTTMEQGSDDENNENAFQIIGQPFISAAHISRKCERQDRGDSKNAKDQQRAFPSGWTLSKEQPVCRYDEQQIEDERLGQRWCA